jgi:glycerophosphoryl diester phosphodiesterase
MTDSMPIDLPAIVAHRGWAARYPENSLAAIEAAIWLGLRYVEFDVQLTADGVPVLFHDVSLERITGRPGRILDTRWADLAHLSTGEPGRLGNAFSRIRPATLMDAANLLSRHPGVTAFVEIKPESLAHFGSHAVWEACRLPVGEIPRPVVTSFDRAILEQVRAEHRIAWVLPEYTDATLASARRLAPRYLFCNVKRLPAGPLADGTWEWVIYEIRTAAAALRLGERGAGLVEAMDPAALLGRPAADRP